MTKPRITKHGLIWQCRAPLRDGLGFGLTPSDAYRSWLLQSQRPMLSPKLPSLVPMHEPVVQWPAYQPPVFAPVDQQWKPPLHVTCWH